MNQGWPSTQSRAFDCGENISFVPRDSLIQYSGMDEKQPDSLEQQVSELRAHVARMEAALREYGIVVAPVRPRAAQAPALPPTAAHLQPSAQDAPRREPAAPPSFRAQPPAAGPDRS